MITLLSVCELGWRQITDFFCHLFSAVLLDIWFQQCEKRIRSTPFERLYSDTNAFGDCNIHLFFVIYLFLNWSFLVSLSLWLFLFTHRKVCEVIIVYLIPLSSAAVGVEQQNTCKESFFSLLSSDFRQQKSCLPSSEALHRFTLDFLVKVYFPFPLTVFKDIFGQLLSCFYHEYKRFTSPMLEGSLRLMSEASELPAVYYTQNKHRKELRARQFAH